MKHKIARLLIVLLLISAVPVAGLATVISAAPFEAAETTGSSGDTTELCDEVEDFGVVALSSFAPAGKGMGPSQTLLSPRSPVLAVPLRPPKHTV